MSSLSYTYWVSTGIVSGPLMSRSQALSDKAKQIVLLLWRLVGTTATRSGASSSMLSSFSHCSNQKSMETPFPTAIEVGALKNERVVSSSHTGIDAQGLLGSVC
jgi:hypothetical protein